MEPTSVLTYVAAARPLPIPATEPVLTLFDTLGPGHADGHALAREVWRLEAEGCQRIHVRINSAGGSVAQGYSLFSALKHTRMEVHTWADGLALSMAGLIFLAGKCRHMAPWSMLMLHNPTLAAPGEAEDPGNALILDRIRLSVLKMYEDTTSLQEGRLAQMMDAETWLTASDALALGLATDLAGQSAEPALESSLRATAEAGIPALEEVLLQARPEAMSARIEQVDVLPQPLAAAVKMEQGVLAQLAVIEEQIKALNARLDRPASTLPKVEAYVPLPATQASKTGARSFREMERQDPAALARLQAEDPARFEALYQAAYGQKGGVA